MPAELVVNGQPQPLTARRYLIGRGEGCDILLPEEDGGVSRRHAMIEQSSQDRWSLLDLGSRNGTLLNGKRLEDRCPLQDGDTILIGSNRITVILPVSALPIETPPTPQYAPLPPRSQGTIVTPFSLPEASSANAASDRPAESGRSADFSRVAAPTPAAASTNVSPARDYPPAAPSVEPVLPASPHTFGAVPYSTSAPGAEPSAARSAALGAGTNLLSRNLIVSGGVVLFLSLALWIALVQPKLDEYQSAGGQFARGLVGLFGSGALEQQYQLLVQERIACGIGALVGAGLMIAGWMKRR